MNMNTRLCDGCGKRTDMENLQLIKTNHCSATRKNLRGLSFYVVKSKHKLVCKKCTSNYIDVRIA